MTVRCVYVQAHQSPYGELGPASLRRSEQVDGGLILIKEERQEPVSPRRLLPEVGEWTSPGKREWCDEPRTEILRGRHASNNDRSRTLSGDSLGVHRLHDHSCTRPRVWSTSSTHTHSLRQCTCLAPPTASDCHYDMPPLHSTLLQTLHLLSIHTWRLGPSTVSFWKMHYGQPSERPNVHTTPTTSHLCDRSEWSYARSSWIEWIERCYLLSYKIFKVDIHHLKYIVKISLKSCYITYTLQSLPLLKFLIVTYFMSRAIFSDKFLNFRFLLLRKHPLLQEHWLL